MPTVGPVEPTGSGSGPVPTGSGEEPVPIGSGTGPVEPTGSGSGPPPMGEGMPCSCRCDCPDGAEQCDCDCNCPMMSTSVTCAPGFTRVCPMMDDVSRGNATSSRQDDAWLIRIFRMPMCP